MLQTLEAIKHDKFKCVLTYYKDSIYHAPLKFILYTGCRPQEAVGLRCKYLDFENRMVTIAEVLAKKRGLSSNKNLIRKGPKTEAGTRVIPLDENLIEMLNQQCFKKEPDNLVFQSQNAMAIDSVRMCGVWKKYLRCLGFPEMDVYALRHGFGTRWNEQGLNPVNGAEIMGHADVAVFFNTYSHTTRTRITILPTIK